MTKRRIILVSVVFFSLTVFTVQTLPRTPSSNRILKPLDLERLRNMTEEERKKEFEKLREQRKLYLERLRNMTEEERKRELAKRRRQKKLESEQKRKELERKHEEERRRWELGREQRRLDREQRYKEFQKRAAERRKGFLSEKSALRPTEEQWKIIKPMLEKVQRLRNQAYSTVGFLLTSSSGSGTSSRDNRSRNVPNFQWRISWKDKAPGELTEAQKIANELMDLVENKNTTAEEFKQKMDALRKSRSRQKAEEKKKKEELSKAQQELREVLTTRQEAALVLKGWLGCWDGFD